VLGGADPTQRDTIFRITSMTKPVTAVATSLVTGRDDIAAVPGHFGWDGGYGTSWRSDPKEDMVVILMTQRAAFPLSSGVYLDFWTSAYQAIDD